MSLTEYINIYFSGNKSAFARHMARSRQKVNGWIKDGWIVVDGKLYSPRQDIPPQ